MVGLVVATHGRLAEELLHTAEGIVGRLEQCEAVSIGAGLSMEDCRARLGDAIHRVNSGEGVLVLTDMFGGTPRTWRSPSSTRLEVVTGVNLPMILKLATSRAENVGPAGGHAELVTAYGTRTSPLALPRAPPDPRAHEPPGLNGALGGAPPASPPR